MMRKLKRGDWVVYKASKMSNRPGPRAREIIATRHGDQYAYIVDKYWAVSQKLDKDRVEVVTRTGKRHRLSVDDPSLRKARLTERIFLRKRFPRSEEDHSTGGKKEKKRDLATA